MKGVCTTCGEVCEVIKIDEGIGPYEYWGTTGFHHDWVAASDCCHAPALNQYGLKVSVHEIEED